MGHFFKDPLSYQTRLGLNTIAHRNAVCVHVYCFISFSADATFKSELQLGLPHSWIKMRKNAETGIYIVPAPGRHGANCR